MLLSQHVLRCLYQWDQRSWGKMCLSHLVKEKKIDLSQLYHPNTHPYEDRKKHWGIHRSISSVLQYEHLEQLPLVILDADIVSLLKTVLKIFVLVLQYLKSLGPVDFRTSYSVPVWLSKHLWHIWLIDFVCFLFLLFYKLFIIIHPFYI